MFDLDPPLDLQFVDAPPFAFEQPADGHPAAITAEAARVRVTHHRFCAEIDPHAGRGSLFCPNATDTFAEDIVRRTALSCRLPLYGGLLLHSAGAVIGEKAVLFHGVSGAGKSTLAELLPAPILSDELVAILPDRTRFAAAATGVWGTFDQATAPPGLFSLHALVALDRGGSLSINPIDRHEAVRRLVTVAVLPPIAKLWEAALRVIERLVDSIPCYTMQWTPNGQAAERVLGFFLECGGKATAFKNDG